MGRREAAEKGLWRLRASEAKCGTRNCPLRINLIGRCVRRRWELFVPLHRLWCGYMTELLGPPTIQTLSGGGSATAAAAGMHAKLVKADFHGSIVTGTCVCVYGRSLIERYACEVRRSRNPALVGLEGIVVQETENTFKVVTRSDKLKGACVWAGVDLVQLVWMTSFVVLPKQGSVFVFGVPVAGTNSGVDGTTMMDAPHVEFELYGNQFCFRAVDRAGRKFKHKESIEL
jgi:ribonuclease P protein subunit POP4